MARVKKLENSRLPQRPSVMELPYEVDKRPKQRVTESQQQDGEVVVMDKGQRQKSVMYSLWPAGSLCSGLCPTKEESRSGKLASLGDHALTLRDATRALNSFGTVISIVNPSTSFLVMARVNDSPVVFLLDTESALTILRRNVWERCRLSTQQLQPWN